MVPILSLRNSNGDWFQVPAIRGKNGITPHIGDNGNWFIGDIDTGVVADASLNLKGYYNEDNLIALSDKDITDICQ